MPRKTQQINTFRWDGTRRNGQRVHGEVRGSNFHSIKAELRRQGITLLKIRKKPKPLFDMQRRRISSKDIALFTRQLTTMISSGTALTHALDIIAKGDDNPSMQEIVIAMKTDIEAGSSLAQALGKHPSQFDVLFCNLVKAGEHAGILEHLLDRIASYKEKTESIKGKIRKALFYPITVLAVAIIVTVMLLVWVVPQFESLFTGFNAELPAFTQAVIVASEFMQTWWLMLLIGSATMFIIVLRAKNSSAAFALNWDKQLLRLPVIGSILRKATIARFCRTLATLLKANIPLVEAMGSVAGAAGNRHYTKNILQMREDIATGQPLQRAMSQSKLFPNMAIQLVAVGEEAGALDSMLNKVADFYEREVDEAVDALSSLMEPFVMVILGIIIGGLVISMYLPIFQMGQVF